VSFDFCGGLCWRVVRCCFFIVCGCWWECLFFCGSGALSFFCVSVLCVS